MFPEKGKPKRVLELDKWIINEINEIVKLANERYEMYDFHNPSIRLKHFIWETFASNYLELIKARAYNQNNEFTKEEQVSALYTLHYCIDLVLRLLAPVNPMVTYSIYKQLKNKDIHFERFPESVKSEKINFTTEEVIELNSNIWRLKKDNNLSLKNEIKEATIKENFRVIEKDLKATHSIKKLNYGKFKIVF